MESRAGAENHEQEGRGMKQIRIITGLAGIFTMLAILMAMPLLAGEHETISLSVQQQLIRMESEPIPIYIEEPEKEWQFEPLSELPLDPEIQSYMYEVCEEYNLSFAFAAMVMESETHFDPAAVGDGGESVGYFQINRVNWERMEEEYGLDVHDPMDNIKCGIVMLTELFEKYEDPYMVLLAYKCGESRGRELFEQEVYTTLQFDCEELCNRAIEIEGYMGI